MILIIGLGNPGKKYENTRHNVGSRVVDELRSSPLFATARVVDELRSSPHFATACVNELVPLSLKNVILEKPKTFMNESGKAIKSLIKQYKIKPENLIVIHDDIDLALGTIRIVKNRGAAGHKGVESIIKELGTKDFNRIRIGICPKVGKPESVDRFVLQNFTKQEEKILKEVVQIVIEKISEIAR